MLDRTYPDYAATIVPGRRLDADALDGLKAIANHSGVPEQTFLQWCMEAKVSETGVAEYVKARLDAFARRGVE